MAWWAPGSQSANNTGRGQVRASPTAKVVTPGEPLAEVKIKIATVCSLPRVADDGDSILGREQGDRRRLRGGHVDVEQDRGAVGTRRLIDDARDEGVAGELVRTASLWWQCDQA